MEENKDGEIDTQTFLGHQSNPGGKDIYKCAGTTGVPSVNKSHGATLHAGQWQSTCRSMYQSLGLNLSTAKTTNSYLYQNELGPGFKCKLENYKMFRER